MLLGQIETLSGLDYINSYLDKIAAVTADDVAAVCSRFLSENNRTVGHLLPDGLSDTDSDAEFAEGDEDGSS